MHIVLTVNAAWNILNFRRPLVEALIRDGHEITVLAPRDDAVPELERIGARFEHFEMDAGSFGAAQNLMLVPRFRRALRKLAPDIVCSYTIKNNLFGAIAARSLGIPFLPNVTGLGTVFLGSGALFRIGRLLYRAGLGRCPVVFVQNADDRTFLADNAILRPEQMRLLPGSGIDTAQFAASPLPAKEGRLVFLMISRLLRDKGAIEYLEAARQIRERRNDAVFCLLGSLRTANPTALSDAELQPFIDDGSVVHLGETDDVRAFIHDADCVVLPSYREGAPRSLMEAASMGRPLVTTDVPGCRAVIEHETTGFLCAARDSKALEDAMERMIDLTPDERAEMGRAGRRKMEREFAVEKVVTAYRQAIAELTPGVPE